MSKTLDWSAKEKRAMWTRDPRGPLIYTGLFILKQGVDIQTELRGRLKCYDRSADQHNYQYGIDKVIHKTVLNSLFSFCDLRW